MNIETIAFALRPYRGKPLTDRTLRRVAHAIQQSLVDYMNETGIEIWNASCRLRVSSGLSDDGVWVCPYDDPLHPLKEYKTLESALKHINKDDD